MTDLVLEGNWPEQLLIPSEADFAHDRWVRPDRALGSDKGLALSYRSVDGVLSAQDKETLLSCGTQCCLVGWAALAFDEKGLWPRAVENPATAQFLRKVCELVNRPIENHNLYSDTLQASNAFEGSNAVDGEYAAMPPLQPAEAAKAWEQAAKYFGYDITNYEVVKDLPAED